MLRLPLRRIPARGISPRSFVSSVLLNRTYENQTVADLRKEARTRGLSAKGNKASLILRIQEHDKNATMSAIASQPIVPEAVRHASTEAASPTPNPATPGLPSTSEQTRAPIFTNINIPDLSQAEPEAEIQIPFVPDFWESSPAKKAKIEEPVLPKLLVVAGAADVMPSHNLHDENRIISDVPAPSAPAASRAADKAAGLWRGLAADAGIPTLRELLPKLSESVPARETIHSRPLNDEEKKGLWFLLGIFGGSWLVGSYVNRSFKPSVEEEAGKHVVTA